MNQPGDCEAFELWDPPGDLVSERGGVLQGHNIVKDVCDAIRKHVAE